MIFPNPNAPTSLALGIRDVEDIIARNQDVIVIVDEAYIDFGGESALPLIEKYDNLLVVQTFSNPVPWRECESVMPWGIRFSSRR